MNESPVRRPVMAIYLPAGKPNLYKNLEYLPIHAKDLDETRKMMQLLVPGCKVLGIHNGHHSPPGFDLKTL